MNASAKTAIKRTTVSAPMKFLVERGYFQSPAKRLDYGCGHGFDAEFLGMDKYDLNHFPEYPTGTYDLITCNYVLNVIQDKAERERVIKNIKVLLEDDGVGLISVRRDITTEGTTKTGTYQENVELKLPLIYEKKGRYAIYGVTK